MIRDKRIILAWGLWAACAALFVALRARFISHLLMWDEAITLLTVRSFLAQGTDEFSAWFYRHPPLYTLMMTLCRPFSPGYAERVEIMNIMIGVINLALLFILNRRLFGAAAALWSCFFLAVIPGSMFFDVWIKSDHGVTTFVLLGLLALYARRHGLAAAAIGAAFLFKETAVFYYMGALGISLAVIRRPGGLKRMAVLAVIPAIMCGWWYAMFGTTIIHYEYTTQAEEFWHQSWFTYFRELKTELGGAMIAALALAGVGAMGRLATGWPSLRSRRRLLARGRRLWPLFVLVPSYAGLSLIQNKTTWIVISLFPAWATLAGVGVSALFSLRSRRRPRAGDAQRQRAGHRPPLARTLALVAAGGILAGMCLGAAIRVQYDEFWQALLPDHGGASVLAKDIVDYCNEVMKDGDRVLLTNFHFWGDVKRSQPCAVFTYYLKPKVKVLMRPHDITGDALYADVMEYRIDWAVVSPEPGEPLQGMHRAFFAKARLLPKELQRAVVYDTRPLHAAPPPASPQPAPPSTQVEP